MYCLVDLFCLIAWSGMCPKPQHAPKNRSRWCCTAIPCSEPTPRHGPAMARGICAMLCGCNHACCCRLSFCLMLKWVTVCRHQSYFLRESRARMHKCVQVRISVYKCVQADESVYPVFVVVERFAILCPCTVAAEPAVAPS